MVTDLKTAVVALLLLVPAYVAVLVVVRRVAGQRWQNLCHAVFQFVIFLLGDGLVLLFSIMFCSVTARQGLRLGVLPDLPFGLSDTLADAGVDLAMIFGTIIPLASWVVAHLLVLCGRTCVGLALHLCRPALLRQRVEAGPGVRVGIGPHWIDFVAYLAGTLFLWELFWRVVAKYDAWLLRFFVINNSSHIRKLLGGRGWYLMSEQELNQRLSNTVLGQMILDLRVFYVAILLAFAFLMLLGFHSLVRTVNSVGSAGGYSLTPPPFPPPRPAPSGSRGPGYEPTPTGPPRPQTRPQGGQSGGTNVPTD